MPSYQLRFLDPQNKVASIRTVECSDDYEAFDLAHRYVDGHAVEIWEEKRFIATVEPPNEDSQ